MYDEFDMGLYELNEAQTQANIDFHLAYVDYLNESMLFEEEDKVGLLSKAKSAIRDMVYSFVDFVNGVVARFCDKLTSMKEHRGQGLNLKKKGEAARDTVVNYWKELKAEKGTNYGEGKINFIRTKISNIIAKFRKLFMDIKNGISNQINKTRARGAERMGDKYSMKQIDAMAGGNEKTADKYLDRSTDSYSRMRRYNKKLR